MDDSNKSAQILADGKRINHNSIRPHMGLDDKTPAELASLNFQLEGIRRRAVIKRAIQSLNQDLITPRKSSDPPSMSRLATALKHPREALLYLILGQKQFRDLRGSSGHTCYKAKAKNLNLPFSKNMVESTNIHEHLITLYMLTKQFNLRTILELGTGTGESTIALLYAAKEIGGVVYSIDIDQCKEAKRTVESYGLSPYWNFTQGDDLAVEWTKSIDHLFIDTSHSSDNTLAEFKKYEPFVNRGGVITMHDSVSFPEVKDAVEDCISGRVDLQAYEYLNNNGLMVLFKGMKSRAAPQEERNRKSP